MVADRRLRQTQWFGQIAYARFTPGQRSQQRQDLQPRGVGHRLQQTSQLLGRCSIDSLAQP